jgi:hypothetical protein
VTDSYGITTEIITTSDIGKVEVTETVETTTTTTTITSKSISVSPSGDHVVKTIEPRIVSAEIKTGEQSNSREPTPNKDISPNSDTSQQNGNINSTQAAKGDNKVIVIGSDGKQMPGIMNIQSVCPNTSKPGTTFVLLNKEGSQMKISLAPRKSENAEKSEEEEQENGQQSKNLFLAHLSTTCSW